MAFDQQHQGFFQNFAFVLNCPNLPTGLGERFSRE
jgi:hypothetical protein